MHRARPDSFCTSVVLTGLLRLAIVLGSSAWCTACATETRAADHPAGLIRVVPQPFDGALRNPLMGITSRELGTHEWGTLTHHYIGWREIENSPADGVERIVALCNQAWRGFPEKNTKVIPRVYLEYPGRPDAWPAGLSAGDYSSPEFQRRLKLFVAKLGQAWNADARVAFVELGLFGKWGEHHSPAPSAEIQRIAADAFASAFPDKRVSVRQAWAMFPGHDFGEYWDSFAHWDEMATNGRQIAAWNESTGLYRRNYIGGEVAYDWGNWRIQPGETPTVSLAEPGHLEYILNTVRWLHCTQLRWIGDYAKDNPQAVAGASQLQRALGYRFVLDSVSFTGAVGPDATLALEVQVRNLGSAPFYYPWPLEAALLDERDHHVVWRETFRDVDVRAWQPGESLHAPIWTSSSGTESEPARATWPDRREIAPEKPAAAYRVQGVFKPDLPPGRYVLALAILDPAGGLPAVCFATTQYFNGGRHPVGLVGFGGESGGELPATMHFDDPFYDQTLRYEAGPIAVLPSPPEEEPRVRTK